MSRSQVLMLGVLLVAPRGSADVVVTTLDRMGDVTYGTLVIGTDGLGFVAYPDTTWRTVTAHCSNAECDDATLSLHDTPTQHGNTSVAIGPDGLPIGIHDDGIVSLNSFHCANVACTSMNERATFGLGFSFWPSLKVGQDGRGLFSYTRETVLGEDAWVAHCADIECTSASATLIQSGHTGPTSLSMLASGSPILFRRGLIAYRDLVADRLKVGECADTACTAMEQVTTLGEATGDPSLHAARSLSESTYVAYENQGDLKVLRCLNSDCTALRGAFPRTVATPGSTVRPSIVIGSDGLPLVAYSTGSQVKTAHCSDANCDTYTRHVIDALGNGHHATFVSAAIGADGLPLIAYGDTDGTKTNLKIAHCSGVACTP